MERQLPGAVTSAPSRSRISFGLAAVALASLLALALYVLTMPPGLTWWYGGADSGDLASAAVTLGIPHPTGYPLFTLLGWLATRLPFGEPAGRLNVMDALIAASAAAVTGLVILHLNRTLSPQRITQVTASSGGARTRSQRAIDGTAPYAHQRAATLPPAPIAADLDAGNRDALDARNQAAPAIAAVSALTLATAGLYWSQAIITEVYALNALLCLLVGWLTLRLLEPPATDLPAEGDTRPDSAGAGAGGLGGRGAAPGGDEAFTTAGQPDGKRPPLRAGAAGRFPMSSADARPLSGDGAALLLGLAQGLALANHVTSIFALAGTLAAVLASGRRPSAAAWLRYGCGIAAGLSFYLLLPLRAAQSPAANWGDPRTPGRFLTHVTGGRYGGLFAWTDVGGNLREAVALVRLLFGDVALWALPAAIYGAAQGWKRARPAVAFFGTLMLLSLLFAAGYRVGDHAIYLLPAYLGYVVFAGLGLLCAVEECVRSVDRSRLAITAGALSVALLGGLATNRSFLEHDLHGDRTPAVFADHVLDELPPGATLLTVRDDSTFALRYAQIVRGIRPDVTIVNPNEAKDRVR